VSGVEAQFGTFDFGLTAEQEERAARLHHESVIVDMLFWGPCGYRSFTPDAVERLKAEYERHRNTGRSFWDAFRLPIREALAGTSDEFETCWVESGVTAGNRNADGDDLAETFGWFALHQATFDRLPWLSKAITADDMRRAKREGRCAGFLSAQNTTDIGLDLDLLDHYQAMGMRMIQLTYNSANYVGGGCTDRADGGVTDYGVKFIKRMNELGIIVDTAHCGKQTTLDACTLSARPVVISHSSADAVHRHDRAKSDEEFQAVAGTGGVIGVYMIPEFLSNEPEVTIERFFDHLDYIVGLVGWEHVGVGTDWPMQVPKWSLDLLERMLLESGGFREEHNIGGARNVVGFDDYRDYPNITRGLVGRGYRDEQIRGILGENFLRVFEQVCG
jgi:membrane dipeptidase